MQARVSSRIMNFNQLEQHLRQAGLKAILTAARVLVRHASDKVPVQTGMARSTWAPLGRYVGVPVTISPTRSATAKKNPAAGEAQSDFEITLAGGIASLKWSSDVKHYNINENNSVVRGTPWKSLD